MVRCLPSTSASASAAACEITSIYATPLGTISLTWSRSSLGIFLLADLLLTHNNAAPDHLQLRLRPHLTWNRKGSKRRHFTSASGRRRAAEIAWDLSLATFSRGRGPEPTGGFSISVAVDGEICLVVGDRGSGGGPIWRRERVGFGGSVRGEMWYATKVGFEGKRKEMEVSIRVDVEGEEMRVGIDGEVVLEVGRLCWKFRGREGVMLKEGGRIEVAWDLYDWFFRGKGEAVFVLRFERGRSGGFWKRDDRWSDSSSGSWSGSSEEEEEMRREGEEGFTLLVCGRKG